MTIISLCETFSSPLTMNSITKSKMIYFRLQRDKAPPNSQPLCNVVGSYATIISQQVCSQKFGCDDPVFYQQLERFDLIIPFF